MKKTIEFRKDVHKAAIARSYPEFEELVCRLDLFGGEDIRAKWMARISPPRVLRMHTRDVL